MTMCPSCRFNSLIENLCNLRDAADLALQDAEQLQRDAQAHLDYAENSEARGQGRKRPMAPVAPPPEGPPSYASTLWFPPIGPSGGERSNLKGGESISKRPLAGPWRPWVEARLLAPLG